MNISIDKTISLMSSAFLERYGNKVDLILHFGSSVRGTARDFSDIDLCWVPDSEEDWQAMTVEVDGVLIDLFAIHWSNLEAMATMEDGRSLVLKHLNVVYARDDSARARLEGLRKKLSELSSPLERKALLEKAFGAFQQAAYPLYLLQRAAARKEILDAVAAGARFTSCLAQCLALINQCPIDTRREADLLALPKLPKNYAQSLSALAESREPQNMVQLSQDMMEEIRLLLLREQAEVCVEEPLLDQAKVDSCAEERNGLGHIIREARAQDAAGLCREGCGNLWEIRYHVGQAFTGRWFHDFNSISELTAQIPGLPLTELATAIEDKNYQEAERFSRKTMDAIPRLYEERGASSGVFSTLEELASWIKEGWKG